jgi:hypothetical protein
MARPAGEVDRYLKKHVFADRAAYLRTYQGKSNLTDHLHRTQGLRLVDHAVQSSGPLDAACLGKISVGWNIGLDDKIDDLFRSLPAPRLEGRSVDIASRAYVPPTLWTHGLRAPVVEQLERMSARFRVVAPRDRVGQDQYYRELLDAKLCVSPFGYGEICWRDFEAILCGCVLVKPDMGHVRTQPDVFIPGETYLPVRWDYADLAEQCERLLADDARRQAMARRARDVLAQALGEDWFLSRFGELLPLGSWSAGRRSPGRRSGTVTSRHGKSVRRDSRVLSDRQARRARRGRATGVRGCQARFWGWP